MDFNPSAFMVQNDRLNGSTTRKPYLIILNQPIHDYEQFRIIWQNSSYRICADGGANRLYELLSRTSKDLLTQYLPDLIHGDLDSLRDDTRRFYEGHGVHVSHDDDQYSTDFQKVMKVITGGYKGTGISKLGPKDSILQNESQDIIIMSTLSGRVDQGLGLIHELYRETKRHSPESTSPARLWFVSEQSMSFILPIGKSTIYGIDPKKGIFTRNAGILPVYGPARLTLQGFEWDVKDWETRMGEMVSTSNHVLGDVVEVEVEGEMVLFTVETVEKG